MQPDILHFLLLARAHLRDGTGPDAAAAGADLQAVDRMLPDTDWFESAEFETPPPRAADLWPGERLTF